MNTYRGSTITNECGTTMDQNGNWLDLECANNLWGCDGSASTTTVVDTATQYRISWFSNYSDANLDTYCFGSDDTQLSSEYTTSELITRLQADLSATAYSGWTPGSPTASFHLTSYKKCGTASKFTARISFDGEPGDTYTVQYTLRTNNNGVVTSGTFQQAITHDGTRYLVQLPEVKPIGPEMDIELINVELLVDCPCAAYVPTTEWTDLKTLWPNLTYCRVCKLGNATPVPDHYHPGMG